MRLYILRHGIAENTAPSGRDEDRQLTDEGRDKLRKVLKVARRAGVKPSLILTSPLVRARQTAEIAAEEFGYSGEIINTDALKPDSTPERVWEEIRVHQNEDEVILASHEPLTSAAIASLLGYPDLKVEVKKGSLTRIDFDRFGPAARGILKWILTPKLAGP